MTDIVLLLVLTLAAAKATIITIPELGSIRGSIIQSAWSNRTIYQFLSVKYGLSTSGERRFLPPEPISSWDGVYDATVPGVPCPQADIIHNYSIDINNIDFEDCLSLNIYTPQISDSKNNLTVSNLLPVLVYIHGGAFIEGDSQLFPSNYFLEHDILLIVPQYRLGVFGFTSLQTDAIPGNVGLLDQVLALRWINKYIKFFGGDNKRVTIFGQSAGACSISLHLLSPIVEPYLFQQAIIQSGSSYAEWAFDKNPVIATKAIFKELTNITNEVENSVIEKSLKNATVYELLSATGRLLEKNPSFKRSVGRIVAQKAGSVKYITEYPNDIIKYRSHRAIPMIAGVTKHDGSFLLTDQYDHLEKLGLHNNDDFLRNHFTELILHYSRIEDGTRSVIDTFNHKYFQKVFRENKKLTFKTVAPGFIDILSVLIIKAQTLKQAKMNVNYENKTYIYTLDYKGEHTRFGFGKDTSKYPFDGGVHHSDDLLYLFPYPYSTPLSENDTFIAQLMTDFWANFAISGRPHSSLSPIEWPPLEKDKSGPFMHINSHLKIGDDFINEYRVVTDEAGL